MATNINYPEINLLITEPVMLQYDANKNTLTAFKHEARKTVPCTSGVFIEAIKQYRKKGKGYHGEYDMQFTLAGYKASDDDIFALIKELSAYIKTAEVVNARPSLRKEELIPKYIASYAARW